MKISYITMIQRYSFSSQLQLMLKGVLRNLTKFTGKHLCPKSFLIKLPGFDTDVFLWVFAKFLTSFLQNTYGRLVLQRTNVSSSTEQNSLLKTLYITIANFEEISCNAVVFSPVYTVWHYVEWWMTHVKLANR